MFVKQKLHVFLSVLTLLGMTAAWIQDNQIQHNHQ